jgi:aldehyde:ferredoxin oxidoreductase
MIPALFYKIGPLHWITRFANKALISARFLLGNIWGKLPWLLPFNSIYLLPHAQAIRLATGIEMTSGKLLQIGERGFNIERMFNLREGLTCKDDVLPERLTKIPQDESKADTVVCLDKMLARYYKIRGWDEFGIPAAKKLERLGMLPNNQGIKERG